MGFNHSGVSRSVRVFSFIREVPKVEENRVSATRRWWEETRRMSTVSSYFSTKDDCYTFRRTTFNNVEDETERTTRRMF